MEGVLDGGERLAQQVVVVEEVHSVLCAWIEEVAEFLEGGRFAGSGIAQEEHGFLGLGDAEADGAVVVDVDAMAGRQGIWPRGVCCLA